MSYSAFKYQHAGKRTLSNKRKIFIIASLVFALIISFLTFPAGIFTFIVPLLAYFTSGKHLLLGPRYLICGDQIVYYANVTQMRLSSHKGLLRLQSASGKIFVLDKNKFPTNARKADKIAKNQTNKFNKVSEKIIEHIQAVQPAAQPIMD